MIDEKCQNSGDIEEIVSYRDIIINLLDEVRRLRCTILDRDEDKWLGIKEACEYTSLSESTIRRNVDKGDLRVSRRTGRLLFKISWLEKFLST